MKGKTTMPVMSHMGWMESSSDAVDDMMAGRGEG
jgi:hypothetical protein